MYITRKVSHNPSVIQLPQPETLKMAESQKSDSQEWKKPKVYKLKKAQKKKQDCIPIMNMDEKKQLDANTNTRNPYCVSNEIWSTLLHHTAAHVLHSTIVNNLDLIVTPNQEHKVFI